MFSAESRRSFSFLRIFWALACVVFLALFLPAIRLFLFDHVGRWCYILLFAGSTSAVLTPLMIFIATRMGIVDSPGGVRSTPR
jgi:hypothetical protein